MKMDSGSCEDDFFEEATIMSNMNFRDKEFVSPEVYSKDCKLPLECFLSDFEAFFTNKYYGDQRARSRVLRNFLVGEIKEVFDVVGGTHLGYDEVKEKLLQWYDMESIIIRHRNKAEFLAAMKKPDESFTLYCLRLETLANIAYPKKADKAFSKLKKQLIKSVLLWFANCFNEREEFINHQL